MSVTGTSFHEARNALGETIAATVCVVLSVLIPSVDDGLVRRGAALRRRPTRGPPPSIYRPRRRRLDKPLRRISMRYAREAFSD